MADLTREEALATAEMWRRERLAVWWTDSKEGDGAKRCSSSWNTKAERADERELGALAGSIANRAKRKNPVLVAKASNLVLIDCDSPEDVARFKSFRPPPTLSVRTRQGRHFYYRPDDGMAPGGIYFEAGAVTPKSDCYLVMPPALHPSGHVYVYENENDINVLPAAVHRAMIGEASSQAQATDDRIEDEDEKIPENQRHVWLARKVGALANIAISERWLVEQALALNAQKCDPPKPEKEVRVMAKAFWKRRKSKVDTMTLVEEEARRDRAITQHQHDFDKDARTAEEVESKHVKWLDKPFLMGAAFQILAAKGSTGKGLWTARLAADMSRGLLPGQEEPRKIAFVSSEDDASQDWKPRLQAADANLKNCLLLDRQFRLPDDLDWLRGFIRHHRLGAFVIDPMANHLKGVDGNDESALRDAFAELNKISGQEECLILGVRHMRKDAESGALAAVLGSTAWVDVPRNVIVMVRDPEDTSVVYQDVLKQNRTKMGDSGRVYKIGGVDITLDDGVEDNIGFMAPALDVEFRDLDSIVGKKRNTQKDAIAACIVAILEESDGMIAFSEELDRKVAGRVGAKEGSVRNVRSGMTTGYKQPATADRPLEKVAPANMDEDQRWRVKLGHVEMREGGGGEEDIEEY